MPSNPEQIFFGALVELEGEDDNPVTYRIVGPDEFDPERGWISMDAPLARALLKRSVDDEVRVQTPSGERRYWVLSVTYPVD